MKTKIDFSKLKTERGAGSVLQICLLVFGVFAFAYLIKLLPKINICV